ncbi:GntR family transcriptional regulator [Aceticella autotrophica]|uniref:GntR family transcriptional regulator n=1 Tax=Aceticella autotrophica TaxID=2755338 RepID=A0A975GA67_9THEO|nr:GntR family transcriptional regulator [Aceticella autotrophica]QSZ27113.1 GntR family transcriptional regulator [Aceticella autotrophica]
MQRLLYVNIAEDIKKKIKDGYLNPGDKLPSEIELAKEHRVSRSTLREAIKMLQREGILISKNGIGTYVSENASLIMENFLNNLISIGDLIKSFGFEDTQSHMRVYKAFPQIEWREKLNLREKERVDIVERLREANGLGISYSYHIFPESIAQGYFDENFKGSLIKYLKEVMNIEIGYSLTEICAVEEAENEKVAHYIGKKILLFKQLHFDKKDTPIFYSLDYMNNNVLKFFIRRENAFSS